MTTEGIDYSFSRPGGAAIAAAGKSFAVRYLAYSGAAGGSEHKFLTAPEITDLHDHGISVVANFESTANRALDGWAAGVSDGSDALAAMGSLRFPIECPVYFSVDFNPLAGQLPAVVAYFRGTASVLGPARNGAYAGGNLLRYLAAKGLISWSWNSASTSWGALYKGAHLWQYQTDGMGAPPINGGSVDLDRALVANYGQWAAPGGAGPVQGADVIYSRGGLKTAVVPAGTPYASDPAGIPANTTVGTKRYLCVAFNVTGDKVAIDSDYLATQGKVTLGLGWVSTGVLRDVQDAIPAPCPPADCTAEVKTATDPLNAKIAAAQAALK